MNKYNIKVGDYVETTDGGIGYVNYVNEYHFTATLVKNRNSCKVFDTYELFVQFCTLEDNNSIIKQVGVNKFHKGQKPKLTYIKKIIGDGKPVYTKFNELYTKLNELIDHVNEIQERLEKEIVNGEEKLIDSN